METPGRTWRTGDSQIAFGFGETMKEPERTSLKKNAFGIKINATTMYSINCKYT